ncbi:hypothetical protein U0070_022056, partial [Myodes glareolus]
PGTAPKALSQEEAVTEGKFVDGGEGRKHPYCNIEEGVQKHHNGKYRRLLEHLQPSDHVSSEPHSTYTSPVSTSKEKKGAIHRSGPSQFEPAQIACAVLREDPSQTKSVQREKRCSEEKIGDITASNGILNSKIPIPEAKEKALADREKGRGLDHGLDVDIEEEISRDMQKLQEAQGLNDDVIDFYMNLLMEGNQNQGYPSVHVGQKMGPCSKLFAKELMLVSVCLDVHGSLVVIDLRKKSIVYLDSMGQKRRDILRMIFQYLQDESKAQGNTGLKLLEWKQCSMTAEEIPHSSGMGVTVECLPVSMQIIFPEANPSPSPSSTCLSLGRGWNGKSC